MPRYLTRDESKSIVALLDRCPIRGNEARAFMMAKAAVLSATDSGETPQDTPPKGSSDDAAD